MLISRNALQVAKAASTDATRYTLNGIKIEADGTTVATDGNILVRYRPREMPSPTDYPVIPGCSPVDAEPLVPFILSTKDALSVAKLPGKTKLPILDFIALDTAKTNAGESACFAATDLQAVKMLAPKKIDGEFPDYDKIFPDPTVPPSARVGFTVAVLQKALTTLQACGATHIVMESRGECDPVEITASTDAGVMYAMVMPARIDD